MKCQWLLPLCWSVGFLLLGCEGHTPDADTPSDSQTLYYVDDNPDAGLLLHERSGDTSDDDTLSAQTDIIEDTDVPEESYAPALYPAQQILSPITPYVRSQLLAIAAVGWDLEADVFMKVGASSTVSSMNLHCFSGSNVTLDAYSDLTPTIAFFNGGDAKGETPFQRDSLAAKTGKTAKWAITGDPSPVGQESEALSPLFALVHFGANDMQMGTSYQSALWSFGDHLLQLTDHLIDQGTIPVLQTIFPRTDIADAHLWVPTYCAVIRGAAQGRQVPMVDLHHAVQDLPNFGLSGDGLHPNVYKESGVSHPCAFTEGGLQYGYNVRNLVQLMALHALLRFVIDGWETEEIAPTLKGEGSFESPFIVNELPFTDLRDTNDSAFSSLDTYPGCDAEQDESGPEFLYRVTLNKTTRLRALVMDREYVDIDLHLLDETASGEGCIQRDHKILQTTLPPGTYHFALDSYVDASKTVLSGEFLFVLLECESDDPDCAI